MAELFDPFLKGIECVSTALPRNKARSTGFNRSSRAFPCTPRQTLLMLSKVVLRCIHGIRGGFAGLR